MSVCLVTFMPYTYCLSNLVASSLKFASPCIIIQFKYINQLDATTSQVYYLIFMYSSTCFGRSHAHHQELNDCSSSLWFYRTAQHVSGVLMPIIRSLTAVAASGFTVQLNMFRASSRT